MPADVTIRSECPEDIPAISRVTELAFRDHTHSSQTEHYIIAELRRQEALTLSLVAEVRSAIVGHVAFSPVEISDGSRNWFGLGPVSVAPDFQSQGIGQKLIQSGLAELRALGAAGCVVLGAPSFYSRFGFQSDSGCILEGVPPEYFQTLPFGTNIAKGSVVYHLAFNTEEEAAARDIEG